MNRPSAICYPSVLSGTVAAIPSKSDLHRKLICAALSENGGFLPVKPPFCDDIAATIRCLSALGATVSECENGLRIRPIQRVSQADLDCGESGSTLRFLIPVAMTVCDDVSFTGHGRLPERPIDALTAAMSANGVHFFDAKLPLRAIGSLQGGVFEIPGNVSSQFLSGLLMALPLCDSDSEIHLTTPLKSASYVEMTLQTLREFGIEIVEDTSDLMPVYKIAGNQVYRMPSDLTVDGDWSNAAFWLVAGAIQQAPDASITVTNLNFDSTQGDRAVKTILQNAGAEIDAHGHALSVVRGQIRSIDVSMDPIPDLLPILAVLASFADGTSHFTDAARLRLKESDRLASVYAMLSSMGGHVEELSDDLIVYNSTLRGGCVDAQNDHRLVMAAAIAASCAGDAVTILDADAVNKSYPTFFQDYIALGGKVDFKEFEI